MDNPNSPLASSPEPAPVKRRSVVLNTAIVVPKVRHSSMDSSPVSVEISNSEPSVDSLEGVRFDSSLDTTSSTSSQSPSRHSSGISRSTPALRRRNSGTFKTQASQQNLFSSIGGRPTEGSQSPASSRLVTKRNSMSFNVASIKSTSTMLRYIADPTCRECFQKFLRSQFSEENLLFYLAVEKFHDAPKDGLPEASQILFMEYISHAGNHVVNINSATVQAIKDRVHDKSYDNDLFNEAQSEILRLMMENSWFDFKMSSFYRSPRESYSDTSSDDTNALITPKSDEKRSPSGLVVAFAEFRNSHKNKDKHKSAIKDKEEKVKDKDDKDKSKDKEEKEEKLKDGEEKVKDKGEKLKFKDKDEKKEHRKSEDKDEKDKTKAKDEKGEAKVESDKLRSRMTKSNEEKRGEKHDIGKEKVEMIVEKKVKDTTKEESPVNDENAKDTEETADKEKEEHKSSGGKEKDRKSKDKEERKKSEDKEEKINEKGRKNKSRERVEKDLVSIEGEEKDGSKEKEKDKTKEMDEKVTDTGEKGNSDVKGEQEKVPEKLEKFFAKDEEPPRRFSSDATRKSKVWILEKLIPAKQNKDDVHLESPKQSPGSKTLERPITPKQSPKERETAPVEEEGARSPSPSKRGPNLKESNPDKVRKKK